MLIQYTKRLDCHFLTVTESDIFEIIGYLDEVASTNFYHLGLCLGLRHSSIKDMMHSETYQADMIAAWLRREGDVHKRSGIPTWRSLVKALKNNQVGQKGIARKISRDKNITTEPDPNSQHHDTSEQNIGANLKPRSSCTCS